MKRIVGLALSVLAGVAMLWFIFRGVDAGQFIGYIRRAHPGWLALVALFALVSFMTRVKRWSYIVRATHPAAFHSMFSATQIGFLANFTLPFRLGEPLRAFVLARLERSTFSTSIALVALDRVTDVVGLLAVLAVALLAFEPHSVEVPAGYLDSVLDRQEPVVIPANVLSSGAVAVQLGLAGLIAVLVLLYVRQDLVLRAAGFLIRPVSKRAAAWTQDILEQFAAGLHVFRSAGDMLKSVGYSILTWAMFVLASACTLKAFPLEWPWYTPFVVVAMLSVGVSVSLTPGFIGQYQIAIIAGLLMTIPPGQPEAVLTAAAMTNYVINLILIVVLGLWCLHYEDLQLGQLIKQTKLAKEKEEDEAAAGVHHTPEPLETEENDGEGNL